MQSLITYSFTLLCISSFLPRTCEKSDFCYNKEIKAAVVAPLNSSHLGHIPQLPAGVSERREGELPVVVCPPGLAHLKFLTADYLLPTN